MCSNQIGLVKAVGSITHPAFMCSLITPPTRSKGKLFFNHYTNVRSMYSVAGSPAELASHVLSAHVPVSAVAAALLTYLMQHRAM